MANLTYSSANTINDYLFGGITFSLPSNYYLGVSTTAIAKDGTNITEPTDPSYARIQINNQNTAGLKNSFGDSVLGVVSNSVEFSYAESSASWGTISHWFISDSVSAGNVWYAGALSSTKTIDANTTLVLPIGALQITTE